MAINDSDKLLVSDGSKTETITFAQWKEGTVLNDSDLFLVNDGTKTETVTWATLKEEGGGGGGGGGSDYDLAFIVVGGGGGGGARSDTNDRIRSGGGGAGGYLNSYGDEPSGGNTDTLAKISATGTLTFTVTVGAGGAVGANGGDSIFSGVDKNGYSFNFIGIGGGAGAGPVDKNTLNGNSGGSGGGAGAYSLENNYPDGVAGYVGTGGAGTADQGTAGSKTDGAPPPRNVDMCDEYKTEYWCWNVDNNPERYGAGGGGGAYATPPPNGSNGNSDGGEGIATTIFGDPVIIAGGGAAEGHSQVIATPGAGQDAYGGGGNAGEEGRDGAVVVRVPQTVVLSWDENELTGATTVVDGDNITVFTEGSGSVSFENLAGGGGGDGGGETEITVNYIVIGGGGSGFAISGEDGAQAGGGGGGYVSSVEGEQSGGGNPLSQPLTLATDTSTYQLTVGAAGSASTLSGPVDSTGIAVDPFSITANAGGNGSASGKWANGGNSGDGVAGQSVNLNYDECSQVENICHYLCENYTFGGGGGAGTAGANNNGGDGIQSSLTGVPTYYAGGAGGKINCGQAYGENGKGQETFGGGGFNGAVGNDGAVIFSHPATAKFVDEDGNFTYRQYLIGNTVVTEVTAGTGTFSFKNEPTGGGGGGGGVEELSGDKFLMDLVVIGGGGLVVPKNNQAGLVGPARGAGGGAGGYISTVQGESSGGGTQPLPPLKAITDKTYTVTIGAAGSDTVLDAPGWYGADFDYRALAGGKFDTPINTPGTGGSGSGNVPKSTNPEAGGSPGNGVGGEGTPGQGFAGGDSGALMVSGLCMNKDYFCGDTCKNDVYYSGGGGAGSAGNVRNGGNGVQSSITGTPTYYAAGGGGGMACATDSTNASSGLGKGNFGSGGGDDFAAQDGAIILRYPIAYTINNPGGGLTLDTTIVGDNNVTVISAGTGNIIFSS